MSMYCASHRQSAAASGTGLAILLSTLDPNMKLQGRYIANIAKHSKLAAGFLLRSFKVVKLFCLYIRPLWMIRNFVCFVQVLP